MKNEFKKVLSILLVLTMLLSMTGITGLCLRCGTTAHHSGGAEQYCI